MPETGTYRRCHFVCNKPHILLFVFFDSNFPVLSLESAGRMSCEPLAYTNIGTPKVKRYLLGFLHKVSSSLYLVEDWLGSYPCQQLLSRLKERAFGPPTGSRAPRKTPRVGAHAADRHVRVLLVWGIHLALQRCDTQVNAVMQHWSSLCTLEHRSQMSPDLVTRETRH